MYWFNKMDCGEFKLLSIGMILLAAGWSCKPEIKKDVSSSRYFDVRKFISVDTAALNRAGIKVLKTVIHNHSKPQTKQVIISNWGQELNEFTESDINKPAWRDSYLISTTGDSVVYTPIGDNNKLTVRRMVITRKNGVIKKISIINHDENLLFSSDEHLTYYPDSLYVIQKRQHVKLLGDNTYMIRGLLTKQ